MVDFIYKCYLMVMFCYILLVNVYGVNLYGYLFFCVFEVLECDFEILCYYDDVVVRVNFFIVWCLVVLDEDRLWVILRVLDVG